MFPIEIWNNPVWCLYDNMSGEIVLKYPWKKGMNIPCPHCRTNLVFDSYKAKCCKQEFKTGFGEVRQREPVGRHNRKSGRGWASIRAFREISK